jgi:hypothetical protein
MSDLDSFLDVSHASLTRQGEELCANAVNVVRTEAKLVAVLAEGLGGGVKANILATLAGTIIATMVEQSVPLKEVIATIIGTLPSEATGSDYATFTILELDQPADSFRVTNFNNPPTVYCEKGQPVPLPVRSERVGDRAVAVQEGRLEFGDCLVAISRGVIGAFPPGTASGPDWSAVASFFSDEDLKRSRTARQLVTCAMDKVRQAYGDAVTLDATILAICLRPRNSVMIFTGPPLDRQKDEACAGRLLSFPGRKVVCGGTTSEIVAMLTGEPVATDNATLREDIPPIGYLDGVDLVTEGMLTMAKALEYLKAARDGARIPSDRNGATLLAQEILQADHIHFVLGQANNPYYQNPLLPKTISIRRSIVEEIARLATGMQKEVVVEYH